MAGTYTGGIKAAATNKFRYGLSFYDYIGREGGKANTKPRYWQTHPEKAVASGRAGAKQRTLNIRRNKARKRAQ